MARTLAEHGAEVLQIAHPEEFEHEGLSLDPPMNRRLLSRCRWG